MAAPMRQASAIAARAPATSVPSPAISGTRLAPNRLAASVIAAFSGTARPSIQARSMSAPPKFVSEGAAMHHEFRKQGIRRNWRTQQSAVVFDVSKTLILFRRAFERTAFLAGPPVNDLFDLLGQFKILVRNPLGGVILQTDFNPCIGRRDVGMVPCGLREMADSVDHHQGAFPA